MCQQISVCVFISIAGPCLCVPVYKAMLKCILGHVYVHAIMCVPLFLCMHTYLCLFMGEGMGTNLCVSVHKSLCTSLCVLPTFSPHSLLYEHLSSRGRHISGKCAPLEMMSQEKTWNFGGIKSVS